MPFDLRQPPTPVEIAQAVDACDGVTRVTVRRLAYQFDRLDACLALLREAMWALERHAPTLEAKIRALLAAHGEPRKETR